MTTKRILIAAGAVLLVLVLIVVLRLVFLWRDIGGFRSYWQERAARPIEDNALIYVALGDSAAQGLGASHPEKGYVGLISDYLASKTNRPVHVINLSVSGAKVRAVTETQLPQLADYPEPDVITIEIGANDMLDYEQERFIAEYKELLSKLPDKTVISNLPSFKGGRLNKYARQAEQANKLIEPLLEAADLTWVDLHAATNNLGYLDFAVDFFHPNDRSYKRWKAAFVEGIEPKLDSLR